MKISLIAITLATGIATIDVTPASAGGSYGRSYAFEYCYYYRTRALCAKTRQRKQLMWAKYRACLKEWGG